MFKPSTAVSADSNFCNFCDVRGGWYFQIKAHQICCDFTAVASDLSFKAHYYISFVVVVITRVFNRTQSVILQEQSDTKNKKTQTYEAFPQHLKKSRCSRKGSRVVPLT